MSEAAMRNSSQPDKAKTLIGRMRQLALAATICGLLVSNIMTLVSDTFHRAAYGALTTLASIAGDALLSRLLASSPTVTVERKIADSTRQIKKDLVDLDIRHRDLDAKHRALKTQHTALEIKSAKRAAAVKRFSMQTVKRVAKNKVVELTSLPERAIPYVGIGVLIGTTAYEIYSDCELLTELNELSAEHDQGAADTTSVCGFKVPSKEEVWRQVKSGSNSALGAIYERLPALSPAAPKPGDVQK